jgi:hypothetical protein
MIIDPSLIQRVIDNDRRRNRPALRRTEEERHAAWARKRERERERHKQRKAAAGETPTIE